MGTLTLDLYIDDSGSRLPNRSPALVRKDGIDAFAFGGYIVPSEEATQINTLHANFIAKHAINIPLHSTKIRCQKDEFRWLGRDKVRAQAFYDDLNSLMTSAPGYSTACVIHRPGYNARFEDRYGEERWRLCKSAYFILVERAAKYAASQGRRLKIFAEATGKREDKAVREYHRILREEGLPFQATTSDKYAPLQAKDFSSILMKNPTFVKKDNPRIQLADLLLYPLVKGQYDPTYKPYMLLITHQKLIDNQLLNDDVSVMGIKKYCF